MLLGKGPCRTAPARVAFQTRRNRTFLGTPGQVVAPRGYEPFHETYGPLSLHFRAGLARRWASRNCPWRARSRSQNLKGGVGKTTTTVSLGGRSGG